MTKAFETYKSKLREKFLSDLICGRGMSEESVTEQCELLNIDQEIRYFVLVAEIDNAHDSLQIMENRQSVFAESHLLLAIEAAQLDVKEIALLSDTEGDYVVLVPDDGIEDIASVCESIREHFQTHTGLSLTFGIGGPAETMVMLRSSYVKARKAVVHKFLLGNNRVICYEEIVANELNAQHLVNIQTAQTQIIQSVRLGDAEAIEALCEDWFGNLGKCSPEIAESLLLQFVSHLSADLLPEGVSLTELFGDETILARKIRCFDTLSQIKMWLKETLLYICDYIDTKNQKRSQRLARKAAQYIDEHYVEKITIEHIANAVFLSAGYLMTIFKREIGMSVVSYLTKTRMDKAQELLLRNELKIYEVAEKVGYANATFFSTAFRNYTGMTPKQFKESNSKKHSRKKG